ncbi:MAG: tetratricopeptide repeat protein [bacterium]
MEDIKLIEEKIKSNPNEVEPELIYRVANFYFINHNLDEALKYYNLLLKLQPNHKMGLFELGSIYSNIGNLNEAINLWQKVISIDPHFTRAHFNLALAYSKLKRYSDALSEFHITLSLVRQSGDPIGLEKRILQEIKRIQEIQSSLPISEATQDIETQRQYALILTKKGDLDNALNAFKEIIKFFPEDKISLLNIGIIYTKKGQYQEAIEYLNRVVEVDSSEAEAYFYLATVYEEMNDYKKAVEYYKKAIFYNPNHYFWYYKIGRILYTIGYYEEAINYYKKSVELNPLDNYSHNNLGIAYLEVGNVNEAIKHFLKSIYLDQNDSYAYYNLAKAYVNLGQLSRAYKSIQKAIELEPRGVYFLEAAKILYKLRNYRESLVFAVKATEMEPNLLEAYVLISKLYAIAKKYDEGISILEKFASPEKINLYLELAQMYYIKGEKEKSVSTLKNILSLSSVPHDIFVETIRRLIRIYYSFGDLENAYKYSLVMINQKILDQQDYKLIINLFLRLAKYEELLSFFSMLNIDEQDSETVFYFSYCNIKLGFYEVAKKHLERLYNLYPSNIKIAYYYFYCLLKTGEINAARNIFARIEEDLFKNPKQFDSLYENYIELLYVFSDFETMMEKGLYFVNSSEVDDTQKQKIVDIIYKSLYERKQLLRIIELENLVSISSYNGHYFYLLALVLTRNYQKIDLYLQKYSLISDNKYRESYILIYFICLLKLKKIDLVEKLLEEQKLSQENYIFLKTLTEIYKKNISSAISIVKQNIYLIPKLYMILGIKFDFINSDQIKNIWESVGDYLKDIWYVYSFDYQNIDDSNIGEFNSLLERLENYDLNFFDEVIYFLPDEFVEFYFYNPVILFLHMLTIDIEKSLVEEKWERVNIFKKIKLKDRKPIFDKLSKIVKKIADISNIQEYYLAYIQAKIALVMGDLDKAISYLFEALSSNKYFYSTRILLGCIYYLREMYDLTIEQLVEIQHDENEDVKYLLGKTYLASKSFKLAEEEFNYLLNKNPLGYKYLYNKVIANIYMSKLGYVEELEKVYQYMSSNKFKGSQDFLDISLYLSFVYILIRKYKEAEQILTDLIKDYPNVDTTYKYLSLVYISTNQVAKILNVYNMGIKNCPYSSEIYSQRGVLYYKAGKIDQAESDFYRAYELNPLDFIAVSHLGLISLRKENYNQALNYFKEAISIKPLAYEIYTNIGNVYEKMGKIIEAKEYFEIAYEHNPSNIQNIRKLIEILKKLSDTLKLQMIKEEIEKNHSIDSQVKSELISMIVG